MSKCYLSIYKQNKKKKQFRRNVIKIGVPKFWMIHPLIKLNIKCEWHHFSETKSLIEQKQKKTTYYFQNCVLLLQLSLIWLILHDRALMSETEKEKQKMYK